MSDEFVGQKIVLYYVSNKNALDNKNSYEFWFNGSLVRIVADRPFCRGDWAEIVSIDHETKTIEVRVLTDEKYTAGVQDEYPVLVFAVTRIYFNEYSDFVGYPESDKVKILALYSTTKDRNLAVCGAFLVQKGKTHVVCMCKRFGTEFEFILNTELK